MKHSVKGFFFASKMEWLSNGVSLIASDSKQTVCSTNHLTSFAVIMRLTDTEVRSYIVSTRITRLKLTATYITKSAIYFMHVIFKRSDKPVI